MENQSASDTFSHERWKDYLERLPERGCDRDRRPFQRDPAGSGPPDPGRRLAGAVVACNARSLVVEQPGAPGKQLAIDPGTPLIAAMTVGQNRWMFHTRVVGLQSDLGR